MQATGRKQFITSKRCACREDRGQAAAMLLHRNMTTPPDDHGQRNILASSSTINLHDDTAVRRNRKPPTLVLLCCFRKTHLVFLLSATSFTFYFRAAYNLVNTIIENQGKTPGFMVLGMHRSGTSMLSGLLVEGFGYDMGEDIMNPNVRCKIFRVSAYLDSCVTMMALILCIFRSHT